MILSDVAAEKAVLASIFRYGSEAYFDVSDIINSNTFTVPINGIVYSCIQRLYTKDSNPPVDIASILSVAKEIGCDNHLNNPTEISHLSAITKFPISTNSGRRFAAKIRKLEISRLMYDQLELTRDKYLNIKGDEPISHILGLAEESIFDFTSLLNDSDDAPQLVFGGIKEFLEEKAEHPVDQMGIPTGFDWYDFAIGGGLRKGTVNVIGARPKTGKTVFGMNVAINVAKKNIPVLYLDSEMLINDHRTRGSAMLSFDSTRARTTINDVETGKFGKDEEKKKLLIDLCDQNSNIPFYHKNIGIGQFEDQLSIMRRWIAKVVKLNDKGKANDCVIVYDYLKLTSHEGMEKADLSEYQMLGFMLTALHNFSIRYEVPILLFIQLNRDGITKETTDTASGSDRVIWLCSNFSIYKDKSDDEIAKFGIEFGSKKLVPIIGRHGEGLPFGDFIHIDMHKKYAKLIEKGTAYKPLHENTNENDNEEDIAF